MVHSNPENIDSYIAGFSPEVQAILKQIRSLVREIAPEAQETISFRMPAFRLHGILLYFAAFKHHIGVFPPIAGDATLQRAVARYAGPKGNLRFPLNERIPFELIAKIVKLRVKQNLAKARDRRKTIMAGQTKQKIPKAAWRTQWPRNGDLKAWLRTMVRKCDAIPDDAAAADKAHLPLKHLAEKGCVAEALRHVNRFLRRLPRGKVLATVRMAELGAQICVDAGDLARMEKYLAIAAATEPFNTRKCDKGFSLKSVRKFRAQKGLLDSADAVDEQQRITAQFERAARQCKQAIAAGERQSAKAAVAEMEKIARGVEKEWLRHSYLRRVIKCHAQLKNAEAVKRFLRGLDQSDRHKLLDAEMLLSLGMKAEAVARARQDISDNLEELRETNDPNIHFPVMAIGRSLGFLVEQGEKDEARRWLHRALKELPTWPVIQRGWLTSSVYHSFAQAAAKVEGPDAAENLVRQAMTEAQAEEHSDFRQGAVGAALELQASLGRLDAALEEARKLRSPTERRQKLAKLLAKAQRWTELRGVLSQVESPEEAAEVAWWIKFELPGGEPS